MKNWHWCRRGWILSTGNAKTRDREKETRKRGRPVESVSGLHCNYPYSPPSFVISDRDLSSETRCSFVGDISVSWDGCIKWPEAISGFWISFKVSQTISPLFPCHWRNFSDPVPTFIGLRAWRFLSIRWLNLLVKTDSKSRLDLSVHCPRGWQRNIQEERAALLRLCNLHNVLTVFQIEEESNRGREEDEVTWVH